MATGTLSAAEVAALAGLDEGRVRKEVEYGHVGGLILKGASKGELQEDYPYLKDEDLEFAPVYTRAYPRMGRPRESQTSAR